MKANKKISYYINGGDSKTPLNIAFKTEDFDKSYSFLPSSTKTLKDFLSKRSLNPVGGTAL